MKKINWNIPAVMYVIIMIWMCFEDIVPDIPPPGGKRGLGDIPTA